jgi:4-hydroxy-2-oxoheptanedioate aldolase
MTAFDRLRDGGFAIGTMIMTDSMLTAEVAARSGFDFLCLDRQHGLIDDATLWQQMAAIGRLGRADPWIRIPWNTMADAMRALDGGAAGIIAPMVGTRQEAEALVRACRYPPMGERSWGPVRAGMDDGVGYTKAANSSLFVAAMIETKDGYENLEDIAATPGLDALFVGPNDLSLAMGNWQPAMPTDQDFIAALTRIASVAQKNGKLAGIHCADAEMARACRGWGYQFVTIAADIAFLGQAAQACVAAARKE